MKKCYDTVTTSTKIMVDKKKLQKAIPLPLFTF